MVESFSNIIASIVETISSDMKKSWFLIVVKMV